MSHMLMCKEFLEDLLMLKQDGNNVSIDSVEMETVNGEEMVRINLSGDVPKGRVRMVVYRDIQPGEFNVTHTTEITSHPDKS